MMDKRKLGMALVFAGAVLSAAGVLTRDWWGGDGYGIGVTSVESCVGDNCTTASLSEVAGTANSGWVTVGSILFYVALLGAFALVVVGGLTAANLRPYWPIAPTTIGFLASAGVIVLGVLFVFLKPQGLHYSGMQAGKSLFLLAGGGIAGLMGSLFCAQVAAANTDDDWA